MNIRQSCTLALVAAMSTVGVSSCADTNVHWSYTGESGPDHWDGLSPEFAICANGTKQSPIDIANPADGDLGPVDVEYGGRATEIVNNGHTIQLNVGPDNVLVADGKRWNLDQVHFHSPGEHRVRGDTFPLEAHLVHRDDAGQLAVLAVLFREGTADAGLASIWSSLPGQAGERAAFARPLSELGLVPETRPYYRYDGSLTTPPCAEGVQWYVLQTTKSVSPEQRARFVQIVGENARPTQPLNSRQILQSAGQDRHGVHHDAPADPRMVHR